LFWSVFKHCIHNIFIYFKIFFWSTFNWNVLLFFKIIFLGISTHNNIYLKLFIFHIIFIIVVISLSSIIFFFVRSFLYILYLGIPYLLSTGVCRTLCSVSRITVMCVTKNIVYLYSVRVQSINMWHYILFWRYDMMLKTTDKKKIIKII